MKLHGQNISMTFGGLKALTEVNIEVRSGEIVGLIGPNGAGKSTLLSILAGEQRPTSGTVSLDDAEITNLSAAKRSRRGVARTFQNLRLFKEMTVFENVAVGSKHWQGATALSRLGGAKRRRVVAQQTTELLKHVGLDEEVWNRPGGSLPYIQQRLLEIARCLATEPDFLLLDEPVAGANDTERVALAALIRDVLKSGIGVIVIEHDMTFLFGLVEAIFVLDHGVVISRGSVSEIQKDPKVIDAYLGVVDGA